METPIVQRVVLIMWDAFGSQLYKIHQDLPNLRRLAQQSVTYPTCLSVYPSVTNVSWASMMTGAYPERTHNLAYYWDKERNLVRGLHREYHLESIVESLARGNRTSGSIGMFMLLNHGLQWPHEGGAGHLYLQPEPDFTTRVDETIKLYRGDYGYKPDFITVYTAVLDSLAHKVGPEDPAIRQLLESMDADLGRLLNAIAASPDADSTAIMLTADHGTSCAFHSLRSAVNAAINSCGCDALWLGNNTTAPDWAEIVAVSCGRTATLYFRQRHTASGRRAFTEEEKAELRSRLAAVPGVAAVLGSTELAELRTDPRLGDIVLEAAPPYAFWAETPASMKGTHSSRLEMEVPLLISVPGVAAAERYGANTVDIAPTVAALLGAPAPHGAQGRALDLGSVQSAWQAVSA